MSSVAASLLVFAVYMIVNGFALTFAPNTVLALLGQPSTMEPWIRNAGVLMMVIGYYYVQVARADLRPFYMWTVYARVVAFLIFVLFIVQGWAPPSLALFAAIELLAAIWTYLTFRSTRPAAG